MSPTEGSVWPQPQQPQLGPRQDSTRGELGAPCCCCCRNVGEPQTRASRGGLIDTDDLVHGAPDALKRQESGHRAREKRPFHSLRGREVKDGGRFCDKVGCGSETWFEGLGGAQIRRRLHLRRPCKKLRGKQGAIEGPYKCWRMASLTRDDPERTTAAALEFNAHEHMPGPQRPFRSRSCTVHCWTRSGAEERGAPCKCRVASCEPYLRPDSPLPLRQGPPPLPTGRSTSRLSAAPILIVIRQPLDDKQNGDGSYLSTSNHWLFRDKCAPIFYCYPQVGWFVVAAHSHKPGELDNWWLGG